MTHTLAATLTPGLVPGLVPAAGNTVNLAGGWDKVWGPITSTFPSLPSLLNIVAVSVVVLAFIKYVWDRRRGSGGDSKALMWALAIGALFGAPALIIPLALRIADWVINTVIHVVQGAS